MFDPLCAFNVDSVLDSVTFVSRDKIITVCNRVKHYLGQIFLEVDLREFLFRFRVGGRK